MTINLYSNTSDKRVINKALDLIAELNQCELLDNSSVVNPLFVISKNTNVLQANYCYVPEFGRYYFINDIVILDGNRIKLNCHVDVLESFKEEFLGVNCILSRSKTKYNLYLSDDRLDTLQNTKVQTRIIKGNTIDASKLTDTSYNYVLTVAGGTK